jgi:hypothetical protein
MIRNIITYVSIIAILFPDPITTVIGTGVLFLMYKFGKSKDNRDTKAAKYLKLLRI